MSGAATFARESRSSFKNSTELLLGSSGRRPWLDVLRGVAVGLVLLRHAWPSLFPAAGIVGVTMFFALSGYLITGMLTQELDREKTIRWRRFYIHRFLRLYPALLLLIAVFIVVELLWDPIGSRERLGASVAIALTYTADLPFAHGLSASISHLWSLAVEEQFYLVWPALISLGFSFLGRRRLLGYLLALSVVFTAVCWATAIALPAADIYQLPTTWISAMSIGGTAFIIRERLIASARPSHALLSSLVLGMLCFWGDAKESAITYFVMPTAVAVSTLALVAATEKLALPSSKLFSLPLRLLASLGVVSYGVYLWNLPLVVWWRESTEWGGLGYIVTIPLTLAAALASWYTVEAAGRMARQKYDARPASLAHVSRNPER